MDIAYNQNLTLMEAGARVIEARAVLGQAIGEFYPQTQQLNGTADYLQPSRTDATSNPNNAITSKEFWRVNMGGQVGWELDLWGKFRHGVEQADAAYLASIATYDDVLVTLIGDVASDYVQIRTLQAQIAIARENVVKQRSALEIARDRYKGGATSELDVFQAQNVLGQTESAIPQLTAQLQQTENALAVLLGLPPASIDGLLGRSRGIPAPPRDGCGRRSGRSPAPPAGRARGRAQGGGAERQGRHRRSGPLSGLLARRRRSAPWSRPPTATRSTSSSPRRASLSPSARRSAGRCSTTARSPIRCAPRTRNCRRC